MPALEELGLSASLLIKNVTLQKAKKRNGPLSTLKRRSMKEGNALQAILRYSKREASLSEIAISKMLRYFEN
jgi:hypothetical protein